jgi:kynureninase
MARDLHRCSIVWCDRLRFSGPPGSIGEMTDRACAERLDAADPLAGFRDRFVLDDSLIYLDGNSLGPLPRATQVRIAEVVTGEWGDGLVRSWRRWIELPRQVGDLIGEHLIGAAPGQVAVCDSTTVNLYKLACAALEARPGRSVIVTDQDNFPTDRYVLQGIAAQRGGELRLVTADLDQGLGENALREAVDGRTALVCLSHVAYRSGALADLATITRIAHEAGALMLWDLCHSAGAVPVHLDGSGADLAVGCTYKYLNAGPGAPAFLYVRRDLQQELRQPVWGWFGQRDQFGMGPGYDPEPGIGQFLTGTPDIIGSVSVEEGARLLAEAGIGRLRAKGTALTSYLISLADAWLSPYGITVASPREDERRGAHVTLAHPQAWQISQALIRRNVIGDYRTPDRLRLGPAPAYTRFTDVWDALDILRQIMADRTYLDLPAARSVVT